VEAVEYPVDKFPKRYQRFALWGDTLTLLGDEVPDGSNANVYYGKLHTLDAEGSTIPQRYEDLIATGAEGYAAVEWAAYAVNRVNVGGEVTPRDFLGWGNEKLGGETGSGFAPCISHTIRWCPNQLTTGPDLAGDIKGVRLL